VYIVCYVIGRIVASGNCVQCTQSLHYVTVCTNLQQQLAQALSHGG